MIEVKTKNGVELFITLCDDIDDNKGGYFCQVYLDEDCSEDYDYFVIHKEDLECCENEDEYIQICCENYAKGFDDAPILNEKMNEIYDAVNNAYDLINDFYLKHIFSNTNCSGIDKALVSDLFDKMGNVKEFAHELAEHYTWDR